MFEKEDQIKNPGSWARRGHYTENINLAPEGKGLWSWIISHKTINSSVWKWDNKCNANIAVVPVGFLFISRPQKNSYGDSFRGNVTSTILGLVLKRFVVCKTSTLSGFPHFTAFPSAKFVFQNECVFIRCHPEICR